MIPPNLLQRQTGPVPLCAPAASLQRNHSLAKIRVCNAVTTTFYGVKKLSKAEFDLKNVHLMSA